MLSTRFLLVSAFCFAVFGSNASATTYLIEDLGTLGGTESRAYGINELGQVVGEAKTSAGQWHAFLWLPEIAYGLPAGLNDLGTLGGPESRAFDLNAIGQIVGEADASDLPSPQAFLWDPAGVMINLNIPSGPSSATAINDLGEYVGTAIDPIGFEQAFYHSVEDALVFFSDVEPGDAVSKGFGLGYAGNMNFAGTYFFPPQAFRIGGETGIVVLEDFGNASYVNAMNEFNQAIGSVVFPDGERAAYWEIITLTDLGTLGGTESRAYGLNTFGQIVGTANITDETAHAFLWESGSMIDLNSAVVPAESGWTISEARAINNAGQIIGIGMIDNETHGFLLTPQTCACDCHGDPNCDGQINVFDVLRAVEVSFNFAPPYTDPNELCPVQTIDVNCDNTVDVFDVLAIVKVAFQNGDVTVDYCSACAP